jgi:hypothetical protein
MKKEDLLVYGMAGAAVLLVAKAMGMQVPGIGGLTTQAKTFAQSIWNPINPAKGTSYNPADPGAYIWNNDLMNGTVVDFYNNDQTSYNTPTISSIIDDVIGSPTRSVVMNPGGYW